MRAELGWPGGKLPCDSGAPAGVKTNCYNGLSEDGSLLPTSALANTINLFPSYPKIFTGYTHMVERMENFKKE